MTGSRFYVHRGHVVDERGDELLTVGASWRQALRALPVPSRSAERTISDLAGNEVARFHYMWGSLRCRLDVSDPLGREIARLDRSGSYLTRVKDEFTIRDGSGNVIGRVENPVADREYAIYDQAEQQIASGRQITPDGWEIRRQGGAGDPWAAITVAFFLSIGTLRLAPRRGI